MLPIINFRLLLFLALAVVACDDGERNFYISPLASSPATIGGLKSRWYYCEGCLKNNQCKSDYVKQCKEVMMLDKNNALDVAVASANVEGVYFLMDVAKADVNKISNDYKGTPLMIAAYYGTKEHQEIAKLLISRGANINAVRNIQPNSTALLIAIWKNNTNFVNFLLKKGADPSLTASGKKKDAACKIAIAHQRTEIIPLIDGCCDYALNHSELSFSCK